MESQVYTKQSGRFALPQFQMPGVILLIVEHYSQDMGVASISKTDNYSDYKINLIVSKTQRFDAGGYNDKEEAFRVAENIARNLDTRLLDYTARECKWVDI